MFVGFTFYLGIYAFLIFGLALGLITNLFVFNFLRNKFKDFYYYFCHILSILIALLVYILVVIFLDDKAGIIVFEALLLIGATVLSTNLLIDRFYKKNQVYDKDGA